MKKLLILGAGIYQVPLIKKAKEMGLYTIVASIEGNYPGFKIADKVYYINTTDIKGIQEIAKFENIDAICTTGTDVAVQTIGAICDEFNLCGINETAAKIATNKFLMKEAFYKEGVRTAKFIKVITIEQAKEAIEKIGLPVMFKAVDSSGSRGIIKVSDYSEIENAFEYSMSNSRKDYIIVEKFIEGSEIGVDAFVMGGKVKLILPHDKLVYNNGDTDVPLGHIFPYKCSNELLGDIENEVNKVVNAIGFDNCAVNMDILVNNNKSYVIEAGGRAGATCIPELISIYCGFDYYEKMIRVALGETVDFSIIDRKPCIAKLIISEKDGYIKKINLEKYKNSKNIDIAIDYSLEEKVKKFKVGPDRIGQIIVSNESIEDAFEVMERILQTDNFIEISEY